MRMTVQRIVICILCLFAGVGLAYLVVANALDKGISPTNRVIALVVGLAAVLAFLRLEFPKGLTRKDLNKPTGRAQIMNVGFGVFGVLSAAVGMMAPRPVVESEPGVIESLVRDTAGDVSDIKSDQRALNKELGIGEPSLIRQKIVGLWGEADCSVVRRFDLKDRALEVATLRVPAGMKPLHWSFTIEAEGNETTPSGMRGSTITATEREGLFPGSSVKFRYLTDGVTERLVWASENQKQAAPELVRCT